jgi:hypothetical protein
MSQRERRYMATNETAKPCPSSERKKSKVLILKEVLGWAAFLYRVFNLVDGCWSWTKDHCQVIRDWFSDFL